jgi:hypothetical protein
MPATSTGALQQFLKWLSAEEDVPDPMAGLQPVANALDDQLHATTGFEHALVLWRHKAMTAIMRFLQDLTTGHGSPPES